MQLSRAEIEKMKQSWRRQCEQYRRSAGSGQAAVSTGGVEQVGNPLTMYFGLRDVVVAMTVRGSADLDSAALAGTI